MKLYQTAFDDLVIGLSEIYSEREANNIARLFFEDVFQQTTLGNGSFFSNEEYEKYQLLAARLLNREPLQYVTGRADFYGLVLKVDHSVLIPRPETEELVHWIKQDFKVYSKEAFNVLDIGTGSGCIPLTLKKIFSSWKLWGLDVSQDALNIAKENGLNLGLKVNWIAKNILEDMEEIDLPKMDVVVSNPPYIPLVDRAIMEDNVLDFEPQIALFVEDDNPFIFYERIIKQAAKLLKPAAWLYFEIHESFAKEVAGLMLENQFVNVEVAKDFQGKDRMIKGQYIV